MAPQSTDSTPLVHLVTKGPANCPRELCHTCLAVHVETFWNKTILGAAMQADGGVHSCAACFALPVGMAIP
eukprot:363239-Chlamydomonas_euryale.AAC.13